MKTKRNTVIFFDDLTKEAQERIVSQEMWDIVGTEREPAIRSLNLDPNIYGYDEDPTKQTLEQLVSVRVVGDDHISHPWTLEWNCELAEFTALYPDEQITHPSIEGKLGKALASRTVGVYAPKNKTKGD